MHFTTKKNWAMVTLNNNVAIWLVTGRAKAMNPGVLHLKHTYTRWAWLWAEEWLNEEMEAEISEITVILISMLQKSG